GLKFPRQCSDVKFCGLVRADFLWPLRSPLQSKAPLPPGPQARNGGDEGAGGNPFLRPVPRLADDPLLERRPVFRGRTQIQDATSQRTPIFGISKRRAIVHSQLR
ncbi:hypothetical protein IscW_ISCW008475, partial [Ixodes scapularis]